MQFINKFFKTIFIILSILFFTALFYYQYQKMEKAGTIDKLLGKDKVCTNYSVTSTVNNNSNKNSEQNNSDINTSREGKSLIKNNNYDEYYNKFNFDNFFLLYEGEQNSYAINQVLDRLIKNIDDPLYSKPMVSFRNFNNLSNSEIGPNNLKEYRNVLNEAKNSSQSGTFNVSFGYNNIKTIVNKIIIEKN